MPIINLLSVDVVVQYVIIIMLYSCCCAICSVWNAVLIVINMSKVSCGYLCASSVLCMHIAQIAIQRV